MLIVKDMMNILLSKYVYVYANVYKCSLKVLQEKRYKLSNVRLKLETNSVKAGLKKALFLSGQYRIYDKLSAVTFRVWSIGS